MQLNDLGDADGATPYPLFPYGGRGAEFYAGSQEVRIHVWVKRDRVDLDATLTPIHRTVLS
jgi:hypothetical protein